METQTIVPTQTLGGCSNYQSIQNKFRFSLSPGTLRSEFDDQAISKGKISFESWKSTLLNRNIELSEAENELCMNRFALVDGFMYKKFMDAIDISVPITHLEPDQFIDNLPQPYRMIHKIIELEIIDKAWLEITRLHEDLLIASNGEPLWIPRNNALKTLCAPKTIFSKSPHTTITSFLAANDNLLATTKSGTMLIMDPSTGLVLSSTLISQLVKSSHDGSELAQLGDQAVLSELWFFKSTCVMNMTNGPVTRVVACSLVHAVEAVPVPVDAAATDAKTGKKAPPKKGAAAAEPLVENVIKARIQVIDVCNSAQLAATAGFGASAGMNVVCEIHVKLQTYAIGTISAISVIDLKASIAVDISTTGGHLFVSGWKSCGVYVLPFPSQSAAPRQMHRIKESHDEYDQESPKKPTLGLGSFEATTMSAGAAASGSSSGSMLAGESLLRTHSSDSCAVTLLPICTLDEASLPVFKDRKFREVFCYQTELIPTLGQIAGTGTGENTVCSLCNMGLAVIFEKSPNWSLVSFNECSASFTDGAAPNTAVAAAADASGASAAASAMTYEPWEMAQWSLCASISAVGLDCTRAMLAIGLEDGTVSLWCLLSQMMVCTLGRHETAVTQLTVLHAFDAAVGSDESRVISGANDGTVLFFSFKIDLMRKNGGGAGVGGAVVMSAGASVMSINSQSIFVSNRIKASGIASAMIDFRHDVLGCAVTEIVHLTGSSVVLVQLSEGSCVAYDCYSAQLLGKISLYTGLKLLQSNVKTVLMKHNEVSNDSAAASTDSGRDGELKSLSRAGKYVVDTTYNKSFVFSHGMLGAYCNAGLMSMYDDDGAVVVGLFRLESILSSCCPGLNALNSYTNGASMPVTEQLYRILSVQERQTPALAMARLDSLKSFASYGEPTEDKTGAFGRRQASGSRLGGAAQMSRGRSGRDSVVSDGCDSPSPIRHQASGGAMTRQSSVTSPERNSGAALRRTGSISSRAGNGSSQGHLTQEQLKQHDYAYAKTDINQLIARAANIQMRSAPKHSIIQEVLHPVALAKDSVARSKEDRKARATRLKKRLLDIGTVFQ